MPVVTAGDNTIAKPALGGKCFALDQFSFDLRIVVIAVLNMIAICI
jgi:hypothetical protein